MYIAADCAQHLDAAIHHTPARVLGPPAGEGGTPTVGAYLEGSNAIEVAATIIATSVYAADQGVHSGWGCRMPAAEAAALDLIAAGWTPPADDGPEQAARHLIAVQQQQLTEATEHINRLQQDLEPGEQFCAAVINVSHALHTSLAGKAEAARKKHQPEPTYSTDQVIHWISEPTKAGHRAAKQARNPKGHPAAA
jgi:hypothetical protein